MSVTCSALRGGDTKTVNRQPPTRAKPHLQHRLFFSNKCRCVWCEKMHCELEFFFVTDGDRTLPKYNSNQCLYWVSVNQYEPGVLEPSITPASFWQRISKSIFLLLPNELVVGVWNETFSWRMWLQCILNTLQFFFSNWCKVLLKVAPGAVWTLADNNELLTLSWVM